MEEDVEIARRCATRAGLALAPASLIRVPSSIPGGILTSSVRSLVDPTLSTTCAARRFDALAGTVAARAGPLDNEEALLGAHLAVAGAGRAGLDAGARLGAAAVAHVALRRDLDGDRRLLAVEGLLERHFHVVAQVGAAALLLLSATAAAEARAEDGIENIGEIAEIRAARNPPAPPPPPCLKAA